ncbi:MAG: HlyD family secretion protein [Mangrovibacterium sp.]
MTNTIDNIEIRSEEVQDVLGATPAWLIRIGTSVIFVVVAVLLIGCWFFKYPDIITARAVITTENPPAQLRAVTTGKVTDLRVIEGELVDVGDVIAVIENTSSVEDVLRLKKQLQQAETAHQFDGESAIYQLGEIQSYYASYLRLLQEYRNYGDLDYYGQKIANLRLDMRASASYLQQQQIQQQVKHEELAITKHQLDRDSLLHKQSVLSGLEYEKSKQLYLQGRLSLENLTVSVIQTQIQIEQTDRQIAELALQDKQERMQMEVAIKQAFQELESQVLQWERSFLILSPIAGKVTLTQIWSKNQNVNQGEVVATVVPEKELQLIGKIFIPSTGMGKVRKDQVVNIKLDNYPYMEFGLLKALVQNISLVPTSLEDGSVIYTADVEIPQGMKTNYGTELAFSQEMMGSAEIITDDIRLLQRFFNPIKAIFKQNVAE